MSELPDQLVMCVIPASIDIRQVIDAAMEAAGCVPATPFPYAIMPMDITKLEGLDMKVYMVANLFTASVSAPPPQEPST